MLRRTAAVLLYNRRTRLWRTPQPLEVADARRILKARLAKKGFSTSAALIEQRSEDSSRILRNKSLSLHGGRTLPQTRDEKDLEEKYGKDKSVIAVAKTTERMLLKSEVRRIQKFFSGDQCSRSARRHLGITIDTGLAAGHEPKYFRNTKSTSQYPSPASVKRLRKACALFPTKSVLRFAQNAVKQVLVAIAPPMAVATEGTQKLGSEGGSFPESAKELKLLAHCSPVCTEASVVAVDTKALAENRRRIICGKLSAKSAKSRENTLPIREELLDLAMAAGIGAKRLSEKHEMKRVSPLIEKLHRLAHFPPLSISTAPTLHDLELKVVHFVSDHSVSPTTPIRVPPQDGAVDELIEKIEKVVYRSKAAEFPLDVSSAEPTNTITCKFSPKIIVATPVDGFGIPRDEVRMLALVHKGKPVHPEEQPPPPPDAPRRVKAAWDRKLFDAQLKQAFADYRREMVSRSRLLDPELVESLTSLPDFRHTTLSTLPRGNRNLVSVVAGLRTDTYTLPLDLEYQVMKSMLEKLHHLPELRQLMKDLKIEHLDVRKHIFLDSETRLFLAHLQRIRLEQRKECVAEVGDFRAKSKPFVIRCNSDWLAKNEKSTRRAISCIHAKIAQLQSRADLQNKSVESSGGTKKSESVEKLADAIATCRSQLRFYEEMLDIIRKNENRSTPKWRHLVPQNVAHLLVHRHNPNFPKSFSFRPKDAKRYQKRLKIEEAVFVRKLTALLNQHIVELETCVSECSTAMARDILDSFGKTGALKKIIGANPKLKRAISCKFAEVAQKHLYGAIQEPPLAMKSKIRLECEEIAFAHARQALVSSMVFAPLELLADVNSLSVYSGNKIRRWPLFGEELVNSGRASLQIAEGLGGTECDEDKTSENRNSFRTAYEQKMWRNHCLHRLFRCSWSQWNYYSPIMRDWSWHSRARIVRDHLPSAMHHLADRLNGLRSDDLLRIEKIVDYSEGNFEEISTSITEQLPSLPQNIKESLGNVSKLIWRNNSQILKGDSFSTKLTWGGGQLHLREGDSFLGLTPEQLTVFSHFDFFLDELEREVKLTAALRLVILDSFPEFSLFLSPQRVALLRDVAAAEIASNGILFTGSSLPKKIRQRWTDPSAKKSTFTLNEIAATPKALYKMFVTRKNHSESDAVSFFANITRDCLLTSRESSSGEDQDKPSREHNNEQQSAVFRFIIPKDWH